ncbi:hypothetical protein [Virgibacillus salinus]|nr:hypothetical protein [Virgibacillus salinus]
MVDQSGITDMLWESNEVKAKRKPMEMREFLLGISLKEFAKMKA